MAGTTPPQPLGQRPLWVELHLECPARYWAANSLFSPTYEASTLRT
jgi:hypothetical protein